MFTGRIIQLVAYFYTNTDRDQLEAAGLIKPGPSGDTRWKRFNHNFDIFILKLNDDEREILAGMITDYVERA